MTTETNYQKQGTDFLESTNTEIEIKYLKTSKHFPEDKEVRDIYEITLARGNRSYTFEFGQSIVNSGFYYQYRTGKTKFPLDRKYLDKDYFKGKSLGLIGTIKMKDPAFVPNLDTIHYPVAPTAYDVLACLTKYDPGTFQEFCNEFGYDTDSISAERTYEKVREEYLQVSCLYNENELQAMAEIS